MGMSLFGILVIPLIFLAQEPSQIEKKATDLRGYRLAALEVAGATDFPGQELVAEFPIKAGDPLDMSLVKKGLERIKKRFEEAGYIDFSYIPYIDINHDAKTYSVSFELFQGKRYTVHRITFSGSSPLRDSDLRSAASDSGLEEGKTFRPGLLDELIRNLNKRLGMEHLTMKDCEFKKSAGMPGRVDITVWLSPKVR